MSHPQHPAGSWGLGIFGSLPDSLFLTSLQAGVVAAWVAPGFMNGASLAFYRTRGMRGIELSAVPGKSLSSHVHWRLSLFLSLSLLCPLLFFPRNIFSHSLQQRPHLGRDYIFDISLPILKMLMFLTSHLLPFPTVRLVNFPLDWHKFVCIFYVIQQNEVQSIIPDQVSWSFVLYILLARNTSNPDCSTDWAVRCSRPRGGKSFISSPKLRLWDLPTFQCSGYQRIVLQV